MFSKKCVKCSKKFEWSTLVYAWLKGGYKYKFECDHCKAKYSIGYISRLILMTIILLPITILGEYTDSIFGLWTLVVWFIWAIILTLISPFVLSIHLKEE